MAIYHFSGQIMSRISKETGKPKSPLAAAAYRSGEKLVDEVDNQTFFYKRKVKPETFILVPKNAPEWASDRQKLWNEVNKIEKNYNAQFAREFNVALPVELSKEQQKELVLEFCKEAFVDRGMVADIAIHRDDENNPHFHVMLTVRPFNEDGSWGAKARREYKFDKDGNHILDKNGKKVFVKVDTTDWNKKETFQHWRKLWADKANLYLRKNGINESISHLSNEDRGIEYMPTIHEGYVARKMEKEGKHSERISLNKKIKEYNKTVANIKRYKDKKRRIERENKFVRRFSPNEKQQLAEIARELKFFVNYKTVNERKMQLEAWRRSILFSVKSETKMKQLSRIEKEQTLLKNAEEILAAESERFIKKYYPTWDPNSMSFDEKILLVEETISNDRLLSDDEIDLLEEAAIRTKLEHEMDQIYANPYSFAMTLDYRLDTVVAEKQSLEKLLNINAASSELEMARASKQYPNEFRRLRKLINHMEHIFTAKELVDQLYDKQLNRLYPELDVNSLSIQEKDFLISGAEYYGQPITMDSIEHLQRYTIDEQMEILDYLSLNPMGPIPKQDPILFEKYKLNTENPRHLLFFKDECLRNINRYPDAKVYLDIIKQLDPVSYALNNIGYSDVIEMNEQINEEFKDYRNDSTQLLGITNGVLQGLLQDRSYSSKKQFEEDLKAKKRKLHRRSGPSL